MFFFGKLNFANCGVTVSTYRQTSNISRALAGTEIVYPSDIVGASTFSAAPSTSSFST